MGKFHLSSGSSFPGILDKNHQSPNGFTLIELLVAIIMLAVLMTLTLVTLNPITQIQKGQDAQRKEDIKQLVSAMDTFYNDRSCYPKSGSADVPTSGSSWKDANNMVYMQKVPTDPAAGNGWQNYAYVTDTNPTDICPQWNVVFAKVTNAGNTVAPPFSTLCPLANIPHCLPQNFNDANSRYNYCVLSGNLDNTACAVVSNLNALSSSGPNSISALGISR